MIKKALILFCLILLAHVPAYAFTLSAECGVCAPTDGSISDMTSIKVKGTWRSLHVFLSHESAHKYLVGQTVGSYRILGGGFGYTKRFFTAFSLSAELGYYHPKMNYEEEMGEAVYRYMHQLSDPVDGWCVTAGTLCCDGHEIDYDRHTAEYTARGNFGGSIRLNLDKALTNRITAHMFVGYRILEFHTHVSAKIKGLPPRQEDGKQAFHIFSGKDTLTGGIAGFGITIRF